VEKVMSQHIEKAANAVMEALGLQKEWATVIHPLRQQGFTVELASTMDKIAALAQGQPSKTSFESLQEVRMLFQEERPLTLKSALQSVLERHGCKRPATVAIMLTHMVKLLEEDSDASI
jgi:hypothetical protein